MIALNILHECFMAAPNMNAKKSFKAINDCFEVAALFIERRIAFQIKLNNNNKYVFALKNMKHRVKRAECE